MDDPLILTTSSRNTAEVRDILAAAGSAEEIADLLSASPTRIPAWSPVTSRPALTK
jgi:hypothetical protein